MNCDLIDDDHASRDMRLIIKAIRDGYPIPQSLMAKAVERVSELMDHPEEKIQLNALRMLSVMVGQNQKNHPSHVRRVKHTHKVVASQVVPVTEGNIDQQRKLLAERLAATSGDRGDS